MLIFGVLFLSVWYVMIVDYIFKLGIEVVVKVIEEWG